MSSPAVQQRPAWFCAGMLAILEHVNAVDEDLFNSD
jgi:hypothetical protein